MREVPRANRGQLDWSPLERRDYLTLIVLFWRVFLRKQRYFGKNCHQSSSETCHPAGNSRNCLTGNSFILAD